MKCNLYCVYDSLAQMIAFLAPSALDPESFVTEVNRSELANPHSWVEHGKVFLLGTIDDETLKGDYLIAPQQVGDTLKAYNKLVSERDRIAAKEALKAVQKAQEETHA